MRMFLIVLSASILISTPAIAADKYHVYKLQNGECEIDTRDHKKMKDQRGTNDCLGHYDNRTDAQKKTPRLSKAAPASAPQGRTADSRPCRWAR